MRGAVISLGTFGCGEISGTEPSRQSALAPWSLFALVLVGGVVFLGASGLLIVLARRRHRRRAGKILVAAFAGTVCGVLWDLLVNLVVGARGGGMLGSASLGVGVVTALVVTTFLSRPGRWSTVVGRSTMTTGFHSLALPIGALLSFLVAGARWGTEAHGAGELTAVILGVRLAGEPSTIALSIGGLLLGVVLVFIGDRVLRGLVGGRADHGGQSM